MKNKKVTDQVFYSSIDIYRVPYFYYKYHGNILIIFFSQSGAPFKYKYH